MKTRKTRKFWLSRDLSSGIRALWKPLKKMPCDKVANGGWQSIDRDLRHLIADDMKSDCPTVTSFIGRRCYGVRPGQCKLIEAEK